MSVDAAPGIRLLTVAEAAEQLGIGKAKAWQLIQSGRLKSVKLDWSRRVRSDVLDDFIRQLSAEAEAESGAA